jgi:hypothetical protein
MSNFYAVIGRICGDDEDNVLTLCADSREGAINEFRQWMWDLDGSSPEAIELMEDNGQGVFVNHVLVSTAPIACSPDNPT